MQHTMQTKIGNMINLDVLQEILGKLDPNETEPETEAISWSLLQLENLPDVPYICSESVTKITPEGHKVEDILPPYAKNFQTYERTGSLRALHQGRISIRRAIAQAATQASAMKFRCFSAPIAVSAEVPTGCVWVTADRIILNETQANGNYWDSDGDRGDLIFSTDRKRAVVVKFPITSQPPVLTVLTGKLEEKFRNFTIEDLKKDFAKEPKKYDIRTEALKKLRTGRTGQLTTAHNCHDLAAVADLPLSERMRRIFSYYPNAEGKTLRALDIEEGDLKISRETGAEQDLQILKCNHPKFMEFVQNPEPISPEDAARLKKLPNLRLSPAYAAISTSQKSVTDWDMRQLEGFEDIDWGNVIENLRNVTPAFEEVELSDSDRMTITEKVTQDGGLLKRLLQMNLIQYLEYDHESGIPFIFVMLTSPNGKPVALTDVKREGRPEGLSYGFLMYPTYDNRHMVGCADPLGEWKHPLRHLARLLKTVETAITWDDEFRGYFPRHMNDWMNPNHSIKIEWIQKRITDVLSKYGDMIPCTITPNGVVPSPVSLGIAKRQVVIDFGEEVSVKTFWDEGTEKSFELTMQKPYSEEVRYGIWMEANSKSSVPLNAFCKGKDGSIRKFVTANPSGGASWTQEDIHPGRPAIITSQLKRSRVWKSQATIAVVKMKTATGVLITPSGVKKQELLDDEAFMPQVFSTKEKYLQHLKGHFRPEEVESGEAMKKCPCKEVVFESWTGQKRVCWTIPSQGAIRIGKIVDQLGNKAFPRPYSQATATVDGEELPVDVLFPYEELIAKGNAREFLKNAREATITVDGQTFTALLVTRKLFRALAPSENVPARYRTASFKGIDLLPIFNKVSKIRELEWNQPKLDFVKALQAAAKQWDQVG